jgi:hypothetical protein
VVPAAPAAVPASPDTLMPIDCHDICRAVQILSPCIDPLIPEWFQKGSLKPILATNNVPAGRLRRFDQNLSAFLMYLHLVGLKGSMRVRGPPPSQGVHIAKAVQEGMLAMFKGATASPIRGRKPPLSEGSDPESSASAEQEAAVLPQPSLQERVKVCNPFGHPLKDV